MKQLLIRVEPDVPLFQVKMITLCPCCHEINKDLKFKGLVKDYTKYIGYEVEHECGCELLSESELKDKLDKHYKLMNNIPHKTVSIKRKFLLLHLPVAIVYSYYYPVLFYYLGRLI